MILSSEKIIVSTPFAPFLGVTDYACVRFYKRASCDEEQTEAYTYRLVEDS